MDEEEKPFLPIVQHIKDKSMYIYHGNDLYESISTGVKKTRSPEAAQLSFVFCLELSDMCNQNENILGLLRLGFKQK